MSWSDLPADIAAAVADRLTEVADLARFRSVCPSWRSASASHVARRRVPLLLLPTQYYAVAASRGVWSPADDSLGDISLPAARGRSFLFASNHGWTLAVSRVEGGLTAGLLHPFTGASSGLPALPFSSGGDYVTIPRDLVWDWSPHGVLVSPRNGAFFCRPGDGSWRPVAVDCTSASISSVTYCDGAFYLFDGNTCRATVVDAETLAVTAVIEPPAPGKKIRCWSDFETGLAVSPAELLLVVKSWYWDGTKDSAKAFRADRVPLGGRRPSWSWSPVADIGERAVFMDRLRAFCVEANGLNGVRRNCLYLARSYEEVNDDYRCDVNGRYTVSVRDLAGPRSEDLGYGSLLKVKCSFFWQHPSWLLPPC